MPDKPPDGPPDDDLLDDGFLDVGFGEPDDREEFEHLEPGLPRGRRKDTNKGKQYQRREPEPVEGAWSPMLDPETWRKLLSARSWVVIGVMRSLVIRAKSKGYCEANQAEVAKENGCSESAVNRAYRILEDGAMVGKKWKQGLKLIKQVREGHQGKVSAFEVYGYKRESRRKPENPATE